MVADGSRIPVSLLPWLKPPVELCLSVTLSNLKWQMTVSMDVLTNSIARCQLLTVHA